MARTFTWRPQALWVPMGGILGALSGALVGVVMLAGAIVVEPVVSGTSVTDSIWEGLGVALVAGTCFGGAAGLAVGLVVGVALMFLVGAHLPRDVARRRAYVWGFVLPPVTMVGPFALVDGVSLAVPDGEALWWLLVLTGASLLGSRQARWLAGLTPPGPPVS